MFSIHPCITCNGDDDEREKERAPTYNEPEKKTINSSSHNITIIIIIGIEQPSYSKLSHRYSHISGTDEKEKNKKRNHEHNI